MQNIERQIPVLPSTLQKAVTEVDVFAIHKKAFVKQTDFVKSLTTKHDECSRDYLYLIGLIHIQVSHVIFAKDPASWKEATQATHLAETGKWGGHPAPALWCKRPICIQHAYTCGTCLGMIIKKIHTSLENILAHNSIGIEQEHILA